MESSPVAGMNCFISGPMSGIESYNVDAFCLCHAKLKRLGANKVYNPAIRWLEERCPERTHEDYMLDCIHELTGSECRTILGPDDPPRTYSVIVMLPGWEGSIGAATERMVAEACGIDVVLLSDLDG